MKVVCIISTARSGSNRIFQELATAPGVASKYEIFHPENAWFVTEDEVRHINKYTGHSFKVCRDTSQKEFLEFRDKNPIKFLKLILEYRKSKGDNSLVFKVFYKHIPIQTLAKIARELNVEFVFLTRQTVPAFVSLLKAELNNSYIGKDTTGTQVEIPPKRIRSYEQEQIFWYVTCMSLLSRGKRPPIITYEEMFDGERLNIELLNEVSVAVGLPTAVGAADPIKKQDKVLDWRNSVQNHQEVERLLSHQELLGDVSVALKQTADRLFRTS